MCFECEYGSNPCSHTQQQSQNELELIVFYFENFIPMLWHSFISLKDKAGDIFFLLWSTNPIKRPKVKINLFCVTKACWSLLFRATDFHGPKTIIKHPNQLPTVAQNNMILYWKQHWQCSKYYNTRVVDFNWHFLCCSMSLESHLIARPEIQLHHCG